MGKDCELWFELSHKPNLNGLNWEGDSILKTTLLLLYIAKFYTVYFGYIYQTMGYYTGKGSLNVLKVSSILNFLYKELPKTKNIFFLDDRPGIELVYYDTD